MVSAYPTVGKFGSALTMVDTVGQVVLSWTGSGLKPGTDTIPGYPVAGKVWEAGATVKAIRGISSRRCAPSGSASCSARAGTVNLSNPRVIFAGSPGDHRNWRLLRVDRRAPPPSQHNQHKQS